MFSRSATDLCTRRCTKLEQEGWITRNGRRASLGRRAKFYSLTRIGRRHLEKEAANWERLSIGHLTSRPIEGGLKRYSAVDLHGSAAVADRFFAARKWNGSWTKNCAFTWNSGSSMRSPLAGHRRRRDDAALRAMDGIEQRKEECRDMRHMNIIDNLVRDVRYAVRTLTRNPGFTLAALLALALGIGANTAVFSVLNSVLLRPLPYADPDRLVMIFDSFQQQGLEHGPAGIADFLDWRARARSFHTLDAIANQRFTLAGDGEAEQIAGMSVTATFFETLAIRPLLGRTFAADDDQPGRAQTVVISERLWRRRYGSSAAIVGKQIVMNGRPFTDHRGHAGQLSLRWRCGSVVHPHP